MSVERARSELMILLLRADRTPQTFSTASTHSQADIRCVGSAWRPQPGAMTIFASGVGEAESAHEGGGRRELGSRADLRSTHLPKRQGQPPWIRERW